jgi:putative flippase GtrA
VSGTIIGQALATIFRYFMYDRFVFPAERKPADQRES